MSRGNSFSCFAFYGLRLYYLFYECYTDLMLNYYSIRFIDFLLNPPLYKSFSTVCIVIFFKAIVRAMDYLYRGDFTNIETMDTNTAYGR